MPRDEDAYLLDMLLAARDGVRFAEGMTLAQSREAAFSSTPYSRRLRSSGRQQLT